MVGEEVDCDPIGQGSANLKEDVFMSVSRGSRILPSASGLYYPSLRVEVKDQRGTWWPAYIIKIKKGKLLVSYEGWERRWDRWIDCDNNGIRISEEQKPVPQELLTECEKTEERSAHEFRDDDEVVQKSIVYPTQRKNETISRSKPREKKLRKEKQEFDLSFYECKPRKSLIPLVDRKLRDLCLRHGKKKSISVKEIKKTKFRVCYTTRSGKTLNRWISLINKVTRKEPVVDQSDKDSGSDSMNAENKLVGSYECDRYHLLSAAGVKLRAAAHPLSRESFHRRSSESAVERLKKQKKLFVLGCRVGVMVASDVMSEGYIIKHKKTSVRIRFIDWGVEHDQWISIYHRSLKFLCGPTDESLKIVSEYQEYELNKPLEGLVAGSEILKDPSKWQINCDVCSQTLVTKRIFCTQCESEQNDTDGQSFDLCLGCFQNNFPMEHEHSLSSFAVENLENPVPQGMKILTDGLHVFFEDSLVNSITAESYLSDSSHSNFDFKMITVYSPSYIFTPRYKSKGEFILKSPSLSADVPRCALCLGLGSSIPSVYSPDASVKCAPPSAPFTSEHPFIVSKPSKRRAPNIIVEGDQSGPKRYSNPHFEDNNSNYTEEISFIKRVLWIHQACAKYSPGIHYANGSWYNVFETVKRGRETKCNLCRRRGATINCFERSCQRSYHLHCTGKFLKCFENGIIYRCPRHELILADRDQYIEKYNCDICNTLIEESEEWYSCRKCVESYFGTFDVCLPCYKKLHQCTFDISNVTNGEDSYKKDQYHPNPDALKSHSGVNSNAPHGNSFDFNMELWCKHKDRHGGFSSFYLNDHVKSRAEKDRQYKAASEAWNMHKELLRKPSKKYTRVEIDTNVTRCIYCWIAVGTEHRKGYCDTILCQECFKLAGQSALPESGINGTKDVVPSDSHVNLYSSYNADVADYCHNYYMTRQYVGKASTPTSKNITISSVKNRKVDPTNFFLKQKNRNDRNYSNMLLSSYAPSDSQIFSLILFTTFYDIPGRVPRWATHSGSDYHGTWIPQIVRISLLRYTKSTERILCNFSGRGTDAIECFLLQRKAVAVDINQSSVFLAQRNVSFALSPEVKTSAAFRPLIIRGDSRDLQGYLFLDESFDHILSHPPYKDCLSYSNNLEGDLSQISDEDEFQAEMLKVASESKRLLKPFKRLTLVIGDNRRDCYYQLIGFDTVKTYLLVGFEIEDFIIKRQRHCRAAPLGAFLCKNYDFLMMTHEIIAILRKVPSAAESIYNSILNIDSTQDFYIKCNDERCGFNSATRCSWHNYLGPERKSVFRMIPNFIVSRTAVSMGTTWIVDCDEVYSLSQLVVSKIVERYGRNDSYWEEIRYPGLFNRIMSEVQYIDTCYEKYERNKDVILRYNTKDKKLNNIKTDNDTLLYMGLKLDLSCEGEDDSRHYRHMTSSRFFVSEDTCHSHQPVLIVIPNMDIPPSAITTGCWLSFYRKEMVSCVKYSIGRVCKDGVVAVGIKDVRIASDHVKYADGSTPHRTHLVPLTMIVANDLKKFVPEIRDDEFRLKDFISAVPSGYQCRKENDDTSKKKFLDDVDEWERETENEDKHLADPSYTCKGRRSLPIIHAIYLVYVRNRNLATEV